MNILEKIDSYLDEASKSEKMDLECMECGKKFSKSLKSLSTAGEIRCPKCRGVDIEPAYK
jgi:DNA-directed RNA polymerase subunit RPC12/RpoP